MEQAKNQLLLGKIHFWYWSLDGGFADDKKRKILPVLILVNGQRE